jgi:hypothetical protein
LRVVKKYYSIGAAKVILKKISSKYFLLKIPNAAKSLFSCLSGFGPETGLIAKIGSYF